MQWPAEDTGILLKSLNMSKGTSFFFFSFTQDIFTQLLHDVSPFSHNLVSDCQSPALANSGMVNIAGK